MKPLSPADQLFLWLEKRQQPMHVAGLQLFSYPEGAGPRYVRDLVEHGHGDGAADGADDQVLDPGQQAEHEAGAEDAVDGARHAREYQRQADPGVGDDGRVRH
ncbi:wax ester/triacylglycerol synthase domain-containing protein, partial [Acinetobacter baumannii]